MLLDLKRSIAFTLVTMLLFGGGYHVLIWGIGQALFPYQANGSLIERGGTVVGSELIAQKTERPQYFRPRPSAVDYNAASTGGSNYGPSNEDHRNAVEARLDAVVAEEGVSAAEVPSESITASGAGMDPHISPQGAAIQIRRVAAARGVAPEKVAAIVTAHTQRPDLGVFGRARINVLKLNLSLDEQLGTNRD